MSMTSEHVELRFCDLCGRSVPEREFEEGLTRRAGEKLVGACCLAPLGIGTRPAVAATDEGPPSRSVLVLATGLLAASVFGAAWWLDSRARARDPGERIAQVEGKVAGIPGLLDRDAQNADEARAKLATDLSTKLDTAVEKVGTAIADLRAAMPKPDGGLAELKGTLERLKSSITDLSGRQGLVESSLAQQQKTLQRELEVVARALIDVRRRGVATDSPVVDSSTTETPPVVETLPEKLGKRVDELSSDNAGIRWEAVDELLRSGDKRVVPYVLPRMQDEDPFVRRLVAEGLPRVAGIEVCGALIEACQDDESIVRDAAHKALVKLSGQRFPFDPEAAVAARRTQIAKWLSWWKARN